MEITYNRKEKIVGIFVVSIALLLLSAIIIIGRGKNWFEKYNTYYTTFDESYNLKVGAEVKLFKTNIGKVKDITVENKVKVKLVILEKYESRIRTNTLATVESPTLIGSEYISIIPGSAEAPLLPQGGDIPSKAKKSIADVMAEFEVEKTVKKLVQAIQDIAEFTQTLKDPNGPLLSAFENIDKTTQHIETITKRVEDGDGTLGNLLTSTQLLDVILLRLKSVGEILASLSEASSKTPGTMDQAQTSLAGVEELTRGITESVAILKNILAEIETNMPTIRAILENVETGSQDVPEITTSTTRFIQEVRDGVENADKVFQSLQKNVLIRSNLPPEPVGENTDAGLRR
jgi:phospholipid/cholesterol/gamma-HCH transport system substrate-binding protein